MTIEQAIERAALIDTLYRRSQKHSGGKRKLLKMLSRMKKAARSIERWCCDTGRSRERTRLFRKSYRGHECFERTSRRIDEFIRFKPRFPGDRAVIVGMDIGQLTLEPKLITIRR